MELASFEEVACALQDQFGGGEDDEEAGSESVACSFGVDALAAAYLRAVEGGCEADVGSEDEGKDCVDDAPV